MRKVTSLERELRQLRLAVCVVLAVALALSCATSVTTHQDVRNLRVRSLIVEDAAGKDRVIIGAPIPEPKGARNSPMTGMILRDANGAERFAAGLQDNGRVIVAVDAPPGKGDDRNRERITMVADAEGGAYLRFLNRKTGVPGRLVLDNDDQLYLEFNGVRNGQLTVKRLGFRGDEFRELK